MTLYDTLFPSMRPSVYVISDSEMKRFKEKQARQEIAELERLIDGHRSSISRLEETIALLRADCPQLETDTSEAA